MVCGEWQNSPRLGEAESMGRWRKWRGRRAGGPNDDDGGGRTTCRATTAPFSQTRHTQHTVVSILRWENRQQQLAQQPPAPPVDCCVNASPPPPRAMCYLLQVADSRHA